MNKWELAKINISMSAIIKAERQLLFLMLDVAMWKEITIFFDGNTEAGTEL